MELVFNNITSNFNYGTSASGILINEKRVDVLKGQWNFYNHLLSDFIEIDQSVVLPQQTIRDEALWSLPYLYTGVLNIPSEEENLLYLLDHDFDITISPTRREKIEVKIGSIKKAKLKI
jgi:hypothetical protein